jgi:hypothetical protein
MVNTDFVNLVEKLPVLDLRWCMPTKYVPVLVLVASYAGVLVKKAQQYFGNNVN